MEKSAPKIILGIETSCDDTSMAILKTSASTENPPQLLAHRSFNQDLILNKWGGVVPEIAARNHVEKITPLLEEVVREAEITLQNIDLIGVTSHPGLLGPLLTGLNAAKSLALVLECPLIPVNHLFAHCEAIHLSQSISYPYLGMLVSGGHSAFFLVHSPEDFERLGTTLDDAAGEAFDKGGKLLGLPYPAGRMIDELAKKGESSRFSFPIGLKNSGNADMSFSGVKTSLRLFLEKNPHLRKSKSEGPENSAYSQEFHDVCASYQEAIIKALALKLKWAVKLGQQKTGTKLSVIVGGGVACNSRLRQVLQEQFENVFFVAPPFCTDNGAMVANYALRIRHKAIQFPECLSIDARGKYIT